MKAEEVKQAILTASGDTVSAANIISPVDVEGELTQEEIDEVYDLLGTALVNIGLAMNKLRPNTSYNKDGE